MPNVKYISRNINLLNILLIVTILIFINYTILPLFNMSISYTLPRGKKPPVEQDEKIAESTIPSLTDYVMIAEDNLFHPERKIPAEKADTQPLEQPEFVLYGTLITDGVSVAYLEDLKSPRSTQGRGKRQVAVKIGDNMSGFTLKEIYPDKVIMVRGEDTMVVDLLDSSSKKTRGSTSPSEMPKALPFQKNQRVPPRTATQNRPISQMAPPNVPQKIDRVPRMPSGSEYNTQ
jgi:hypothetical protein